MTIPRSRVVVAMSGGVDSSVAAALLVEEGHDVSGVMLRLWTEQQSDAPSTETEQEAHEVARQLGIKLNILDYRDAFRTCVVDHFIREYGLGRTPNPCLACNRDIKFGRLLRYAQNIGADYVATGHYARIGQDRGDFVLHTGVDPLKDQSYALYMLGPMELRHLMFPVGAYRKAQVRDMARQWDLPIANKDESMEICFVQDNDYRRFLRMHAPHTIHPGPILDRAGQQIGTHEGLSFYTIGQRRGLGIAAPKALYVLALDPTRNAVIVGPAEALGRTSLVAHNVSYVRGAAPDNPIEVEAKIRYKAKRARAVWHALTDGRARVEFESPVRDITPGQAVVAYEGDTVLGGGTISE